MPDMAPKHTPGPWRLGRPTDTVVADSPVPDVGGSADMDYYGGHLIGESISPRNRPLIAAAPDLFAELVETAAWLDGRAGELRDMAGETRGSLNRDRLRIEATKLEGRAMLLRQAAAKAVTP